MANEALRDIVAAMADAAERFSTAMNVTLDKAIDLLDTVAEAFDEQVQDEPAPQSGPVEEETTLSTMIDYIYDKVQARGYNSVDEETFKSALRAAPYLTKSTYDTYKAQEQMM